MTRDEAIAEQERLFPKSVWKLSGSDTIRIERRGPTLPEICLDLRQSCNGAADQWPTEFLQQVVTMLAARLDTWSASKDTMDHHVAGMCWQAVYLGRAELADRARVAAEKAG